MKLQTRDNALFEAGIKLGALYHQFTGAPVNLDTIESLEKAIEKSISLQPYVQDIKVQIDKKMVQQKLNKFGYCELEGKMLKVQILVVFGSVRVYAGLKYMEDLDYPMMYIEKVINKV